jgi:hypothetical protein
MRVTKWLPVILIATLAAVAVVLLRPSAGPPANAQQTVATNECDDIPADLGLGTTFEGMASRRFRQCDPIPQRLAKGALPPPVRRNLVTRMYGRCEAADGEGCAPPLEVQTWPACERNLALYHRYPSPDGDPVPYTEAEVRGVPAAIFDEGRRIEVYTGDVTVVIFADTPPLARRAAASLRGSMHGAPLQADEPLPAPMAGALEGKLPC